MNNKDQELKDLIANALECDISSITPDSGLGKHYNWDSLGHAAVMAAKERKYGIEDKESNIIYLSNFASIKNYISKYAK